MEGGEVYKTRGGGHVKFYPYKKWDGKSFSHTEEGGVASNEVVLNLL